MISIDLDNLDFIASIDDEPPKKKRKRKPSKEKMLRSAQKKQAKVLLSEMLANGDCGFEMDGRDYHPHITLGREDMTDSKPWHFEKPGRENRIIP